MTHPASTTPRVDVMWRPGCPFCGSLRRGLRRAGVMTVEHDIWSSTDAAARVRRATGGDETVPTVFVGKRALVNPSVAEVVAAIRTDDPAYQPTTPARFFSGAGARVASLMGVSRTTRRTATARHRGARPDATPETRP